MTRLFHQMLVSADGFIAGPDGEFDWHTVDDDFSRYVDGMLRSIDMIVMGRVTYDGLSQYWPTADEPEALTTLARARELEDRALRAHDLDQAEYRTVSCPASTPSFSRQARVTRG